MAYLPDTSVILRLNEPGNPLCKIVSECLDKLSQNGEELVLVPQVLVDFGWLQLDLKVSTA